MRLPSPAEAMRIAQETVHQLDKALMEGDFDLYSELLYVPHHIRTKIETFDIRTQKELRACFERYRQHAVEEGAVSCERKVETGRFRNPHRIEARYSVTYFTEAGEPVVKPTYTNSIFMIIGGKWRICGSDSNSRRTTGIGEAVQRVVAENMTNRKAG